MLVTIKEIVRAVDVFLCKVDCPKCGREDFLGFPIKDNCSECGFEYTDAFYEVDCANKRNLVAFEKNVGRKKIGKKMVRLLNSIQQNQCAYCDKTMTNYHVEHIIPVSVGGTNNLDNLCLACPRCNQLASNFYFPNLMAKRKYIIEKLIKEQK
jgi:ribosomal protein L37E